MINMMVTVFIWILILTITMIIMITTLSIFARELGLGRTSSPLVRKHIRELRGTVSPRAEWALWPNGHEGRHSLHETS